MLFTVSPAKSGDFKRAPTRKGVEQPPVTESVDAVAAAKEREQFQQQKRGKPTFTDLLEDDMTASAAFDAMMIVSGEPQPAKVTSGTATQSHTSAKWEPPYSYSHLRDIEV